MDLDDLNFYRKRPQIGNAPIQGLKYFLCLKKIKASDRSISYPRPLSIEIEIILICQDLDEIYLKYYKRLIGVYLIGVSTISVITAIWTPVIQLRFPYCQALKETVDGIVELAIPYIIPSK